MKDMHLIVELGNRLVFSSRTEEMLKPVVSLDNISRIQLLVC
jgi:hypothetical protein